MAGVSYGKSRKKAPVLIDLVSPHGARVTVSEERAETLLKRAPVDMPDGQALGWEYDESDEDSSSEKAPQSRRKERTVDTKKVDVTKDGDK